MGRTAVAPPTGRTAVAESVALVLSVDAADASDDDDGDDDDDGRA